MRPMEGEVLHFSEDPAIRSFVPHVAHHEAGIQLRVLPNLWAFWEAVIASTLGFSGIRLRNARPGGPS